MVLQRWTKFNSACTWLFVFSLTNILTNHPCTWRATNFPINLTKVLTIDYIVDWLKTPTLEKFIYNLHLACTLISTWWTNVQNYFSSYKTTDRGPGYGSVCCYMLFIFYGQLISKPWKGTSQKSILWLLSLQIKLSRHMGVCRVAQENRACANGVSILTGTTKSRFLHIRSSVMFYPNGTKFTVESRFRF